LIRILGDIDLAEEAVQDAYAIALERWPERGIPADPAAWLFQTARNRALDMLRHRGVFTQKLPLLEREALASSSEPEIEEMGENMDQSSIVDDRLRLIFNEGYAATSTDTLVRRELCAEAIRLAQLLAALTPDEPEATGLLALMLLHDSRRDTRTDEHGHIVVLDEQDRSRWDQAEIAEGLALAERAMRSGRRGPYALQAAIAALHAEAATAAATDWDQIVLLYGELLRHVPTPVVELNRAVAVAMAYGFEAGLELVDAIAESGALGSYHLLDATRADFLRRLGRDEQAAAAYERALRLAASPTERAFLTARLRELSPTSLP
jgi:RNA polymerase sigma-70 factor (ECF subfamily)